MSPWRPLTMIRLLLHPVIDRLDEIEQYIDAQDGFFESRQRRFSLRANRAIEDAPPEGRGDVAERLAERSRMDSCLFPALQWYGVFVMTWAFFEREMVALCQEDLRRRNGCSPPETTKRGKKAGKQPDDIQGVREYWTGQGVVAPFDDDPEKETPWKEILHYKDIRDQIAHRNGMRSTSDHASKRAKDGSREVDEYVESREKMKKGGIFFVSDALVLTPDFCREAVGTIRKFLGELDWTLPPSGDAFARPQRG